MAHPPPTNIPPNELFTQLTSVPRPSRTVDLPRVKPGTTEAAGQVLMRVLTQTELIQAAAEAEDFTRKAMKEVPKAVEANIGYENIYNNASSVEILYRACRRVDNPEWPFFPTPRAMRDALTQDEIGVLMRSYLILQAELGPIVAHMSEGEVDAWIRRLVEGGSTLPLSVLSSEGVSDLVMHMASRLYTSPTDTSSPGSQPDASTTSADEETATDP